MTDQRIIENIRLIQEQINELNSRLSKIEKDDKKELELAIVELSNDVVYKEEN